ncbi:MAG TPA: cell division protein ZapE [Pseudomonadales bacterium]|nr:cell division protein ZapE [Pseudomonadales bacterium]
MTPIERYQHDLLRPDFVADAAQKMAVDHLQRLYDDLLAQASGGLLSSLFRRNKKPCRGLYFWGGVGRGKTYLMDTFFEALPFEKKLRLHFHRFMRRVHQEIRTLKDQENPLEIVADRIAGEARILCFDEFFVSDIADAMILGNLMEKLFARGVSLVATSNIVPDRLYENGLQRERFLPAIAVLKAHVEVVNVDGGTDYRLRTLTQAKLYHWPLDDEAEQSLARSFTALSAVAGHDNVDLEVEGRIIHARKEADDVAWFDFRALCDGPRSQNDYIELAREYHTVLLSGIPALHAGIDDQVRRFINLVDEFYDRNVKLVISAEQSLEKLYSGGRLNFEFQRTQSRLLEMQSHEYLAREHRPE